jgi:type IV pilus assembly protein PilY1
MRRLSFSARSAALSLAAVMLWSTFAAHSATTDIANAPMASASSTVVKPNIMFILDDSGSMSWSYLGDNVHANGYVNKIGYRNHLCNKAYYNRATTYTLPVNADGTSFPAPSFTAAYYDGFKANSTTVDLSTGFMAWRSNNSSPATPTGYFRDCWDGSSNASCSAGGSNTIPNAEEPAYYFVYKGNRAANLGDNSSNDHCKNDLYDTSATGTRNWYKVIVGSTTGPSATDERQNFANWYSYYRTRMLTMKAAAGRAFNAISSNYRVGYSTISYEGVDSTNADFMKIADFNTTQKAAFYTKLYGATPKLYTPLRAALSKAGRIYAGELLTGINDPVQYSCQQNFTILSTDGYWNANSENESYGPKQIDGVTDVGNQDISEPRPKFDGSNVVVTTQTPTTTIERKQTVTTKTTTTPYARNVYRLGAVNGDGCNGSKRRVFTQPQKYTRTKVETTTSVDDVTTTVTRTVVTTNGTVTSDTTTTGTPTSSNVSSDTTQDSDTGAPTVSSGWTNNGTESSSNCQNSPTLPNPNPSTASSGTATVNTSAPVTTVLSSSSTTGSTTTSTNASASYSNTLADVASYYYKTDLRTARCTGALGDGINVCTNNVPGAGVDIQPQQHMTTFTLGLGVNGILRYTDDYESASSGDFYDIKQGTKNWPDPISNAGAQRIDDLWHAAVNGAGTYFSAQNPDSLVASISKALAGVSARTGAAAAAATSNLEPVAGDNFVYVALYRTVNWDGDLQAKTIDPATGALSATPDWAAQSQLDAKVAATSDTRTIYKFDSSVTSKLKTFTWANLSAAEQAYFNGMCSPTSMLSQCPNLTTTQQAAASGVNLVNFIRGQHQHEDRTANTDKLYRERAHVLGDMINSQPVYVKQPPFAYNDSNYTAFKSERSAVGDARVYVAVNDGMLHAFNAADAAHGGGAEVWAYIPPMVMPNLYKLADKNYSSNHRYYVDGSPTVGDVCPNAPGSSCTANQWKTILVGGLNAGGRGYYALDITDPDNPKALWNYTVDNDNDLGYTFGNPIITKRRDGTWVVVFTSGYNNVSPGDGQGHLYVLNAYTGARLEKISTTVGDTTTPSGLAKINAWIDSTVDNTAMRFYGGDLLGNVWRFDTDDRYLPDGKEALLIAELGNVGSVGAQPITIKPELTEINVGGTPYAVVNIATGRYLGTSDLNDTSQQSIYAFKDNIQIGTGLGKVRTSGILVNQTLITNSGGTTRTTSTNPVNWAANAGWYIDLNPNNESPGERVNVDMQQQLGLLTVAANVPENNACTLGGYAWLYAFDYKTGQFVQTAANNVAGKKLLQNSLVAGLKTVKLTTGKTVTLVTDTGGGITPNDDPSSNPGTGNGAKRVSWRELFD